MTYGYVRVSTQEQNEGRQLELMKRYKIDKTHIYSEKLSGKDTNRPELKKLLQIVKKGDCIVVESYSRLARNTKDLLSIIDELKAKEVSFISDKESIDTTTPQGELMLTIFAGLAQFERACTLERQREGIELAKAAGKYKGRKPIQKPANFDKIYQRWQNKELTATEAMKILGLKRNTFYKLAKEVQ